MNFPFQNRAVPITLTNHLTSRVPYFASESIKGTLGTRSETQRSGDVNVCTILSERTQGSLVHEGESSPAFSKAFHLVACSFTPETYTEDQLCDRHSFQQWGHSSDEQTGVCGPMEKGESSREVRKLQRAKCRASWE